MATIRPLLAAFRETAPAGSRLAPALPPDVFTLWLVRAGGLEPPQALRPYGFSYQLRLSPPLAMRAFVVWTIPSPCPAWRGVGAARLVSTPSRRRAWLGIAILQGSPNLSSSTARVSPRALKLSKSGASTNFATPAQPGAGIVRREFVAKEDVQSVRSRLTSARWRSYASVPCGR